jgi:hypothetical protein
MGQEAQIPEALPSPLQPERKTPMPRKLRLCAVGVIILGALASAGWISDH